MRSSSSMTTTHSWLRPNTCWVWCTETSLVMSSKVCMLRFRTKTSSRYAFRSSGKIAAAENWFMSERVGSVRQNQSRRNDSENERSIWAELRNNYANQDQTSKSTTWKRRSDGKLTICGFEDFNRIVCFQIAINESLQTLKHCYDVLVMETENKRIMDSRLEKILAESSI